MVLKKYVPIQSETRQASTGLRRVKLLCVEDEDINWEATLLNLRDRYHIRHAKNSREAFDLLRNNEFNAILVNAQLSNSDLDGIGIAQILRGTFRKPMPDYAKDFTLPQMPIVFMTDYSARYSREDLIAAGGDDLVSKPIDFTHLGLTLSRCLLRSMNRS